MLPVEQLFLGNLTQQSLSQRWNSVLNMHAVNEMAYINLLSHHIQLDSVQQHEAEQCAIRWIHQLREQKQQQNLDPLLQEFRLSTPDGLALMTLAEALLRIPDGPSADALIRDRLRSAEWDSSQDLPSSLWINLSSWALSHAKHWFADQPEQKQSVQQIVRRLGEPMLRNALQQAIKLIANQYVAGETIAEGLDNSQMVLSQGGTYSFDMLGEAAVCADDVHKYETAYFHAIEMLGKNESYPPGCHRPGISIKLSALHPRFEATQGGKMLSDLEATLTHMVSRARHYNIPITIDAEESDRLEPTLQLLERLLNGAGQGWGKLGIAVQAYNKRALAVLHWLEGLAESSQTTIPIRLVKGAYWDTEIKLAQQRGDSDYPVFTRKAATDISYLACTQFLLSEYNNYLIPQFATHNALTLSQIVQMESPEVLECQRLHGMGENLHKLLKEDFADHYYTRVYAPIGPHQELLPYLIRRLLENGANSSFVNQLLETHIPAYQIAKNPIDSWHDDPTPSLPAPGELYLPRLNSRGINLQLGLPRQQLTEALLVHEHNFYFAAPLIDGEPIVRENQPHPKAYSPANTGTLAGELYPALPEDIEPAYQSLLKGQPRWASSAVDVRASIIERYASLLETHASELIQLCIRETGKTISDSLAEIREAVDLARFYAQQARVLMNRSHKLPSITGENNCLQYVAKGLFLCISPWNFPIAIFSGQICAALVCGNAVLAKPSRQSSLLAYRCCQLLLEAGVPKNALALLPGKSDVLGHALVAQKALAGIAFTGSSLSAKVISQQLANRDCPRLPRMIAETGGLNALIADSTTLLEQLVKDSVQSAFTSSGQRCSALRVIYLQEEIYERSLTLLQGAMAELVVGLPSLLRTDLGPIISAPALESLQRHIEFCRGQNRVIYQTPLEPQLAPGFYLPPTLIRLESIHQLHEEHFGPILHVIPYQSEHLDQILDDINQTGYGLTFGIHSRNESMVNHISRRIKAGNVYVNRNQIGATVGCQPFGGTGLSGTGPKAGGPNYLQAFTDEQCVTINTTAWGGNVSLLNQDKDL